MNAYSPKSAEERLLALARVALKDQPQNYIKAADMVMKAIYDDAEMLRALFEPYRAQALRTLIGRAAQTIREKEVKVITHKRAKPRPARPSEQERVAVVETTRIRYLQAFIVNGKPLGKVTPMEARNWALSRARDASFIFLVTQGLPLDEPIEKFRTEEEVARMYQEASDRTRDAA